MGHGLNRAGVVLPLMASSVVACPPTASHFCQPCSEGGCGPGLSCAQGVCVVPDAPDVCANYIAPVVCGGSPPCSDGLECFDGQCRAPIDIKVGRNHACVLWASGRVSCWGNNRDGKTGSPDLVSVATPYQLPSIRDAREIAAGIGFSCARLADGEVRCWGANVFSQLGGLDLASTRNDPAPVFLTEPSTRLFGSWHRGCALGEDDGIWCWGSGGAGWVFGDALADSAPVPIRVADATGVIDLSVGPYHTAWLKNGRIYGIGTDPHGQLGVGTAEVPTDLGFSEVTHMASSDGLTCGVSKGRYVRCRGSLASGRMAYDYGQTVKQIAAWGHIACVVLADGGVECWGHDEQAGLLGTFDYVDRPSGPPQPVDVPGARGADRIDLGQYHACIIRDGDGTFCWGGRNDGVLADGGTRWRAPEQVDSDQFVDLSVGHEQSCAVRVDGAVVCWGSNLRGELGLGFSSAAERPTAVPGLSATHVAISEQIFCAHTFDGYATCWGAFAPSPLPTRLDGLGPIRQLAGGWDFVCALTEAREVFCFGRSVDRLTFGHAPGAIRGPTRVPLPAGATYIRVNGGNICGMWPNNRIHCVGPGDNEYSVTDITGVDGLQVDGAVDFQLGLRELFVLKDDGTVMGAGFNEGRIGNGDKRRSLTLQPAIGVTDAIAISARRWHSCALRQKGEVWCWPDLGVEKDSFLPTPVEGLPPAESVVVGHNRTCALPKGGGVWCWGDNRMGAVNGVFGGSLTPVRIQGLRGRGPVD